MLVIQQFKHIKKNALSSNPPVFFRKELSHNQILLALVTNNAYPHPHILLLKYWYLINLILSMSSLVYWRQFYTFKVFSITKLNSWICILIHTAEPHNWGRARFELTDCKLQFVVHLECFAEHFFVIFMKSTNQFLTAHCNS